MAYSAVDMMQTTRECLVLDVAECFKGHDVVEVLGYRHAHYNNLFCYTCPSLILLRIFGRIYEATIGPTGFMLTYDALRHAAIDAWHDSVLNPTIIQSVCRPPYAERIN